MLFYEKRKYFKKIKKYLIKVNKKLLLVSIYKLIKNLCLTVKVAEMKV
jgi:hypothetical protein